MTITTPFSEDKVIGIINTVRADGQTVLVEEDAFINGKIVVGGYVLVKLQNKALFGNLAGISRAEIGLTGLLELIATIDLNSQTIQSGIAQQPFVGAKVYSADPNLVKSVIEYESGIQSGKITLHLGSLPHNREVLLNFSPEKIFGRHIAVVGTSGSGKSWSVARLITEAARLNSKVILLDPTGEYHTLRTGTKHVYIGVDTEVKQGEEACSLPYFHLNESDLFGIFQPKGQSQAANLRSAIESLKIARLAPYLAPDGTIIKAFRSKLDFVNEQGKFSKEIEDPRAHFDVTKLCYQIRHECVDSQRSPTEPMFWGGHNSNDYSACVPLINRIQDAITSPSLVPIFQPGSIRSLFDEISIFLKDNRFQVLRINLQHLSFAYRAREIIANALGRYLLAYARTGSLRSRPVVIFIDEAHQFLNRTLVNQDDIFPLDSFALIAKEGRKYALTTALATQRPRDIPEDVLSQMGTMIVHRLINQNDKNLVISASGFIDASTASQIPVLSSGQAILVGVDFPIPLNIVMEMPIDKPDSRGADYQKYWRHQ
jgi:uncharacterized protein